MSGKIDIGSIIKNTLKLKNMSVSAFAESINCTERNAYKIFNKRSIDTDMLAKINKVLGKNLFVHYIPPEESLEMLLSGDKEEELIEVIKDLSATVSLLKTLKKEKFKK